MTSAVRRRTAEMLQGIPSALMLALLTAATTIILAMILSAVVGAENRALQRQAVSNAQEVLDHAVIARCELAHVVDILKDIGEQSSTLDLTEYEDINVDGLDCAYILSTPFNPGLNYIEPVVVDPDGD